MGDMYAWKKKVDGSISVPKEPRRTLEELFRYSSFGLPPREVINWSPIKIKLVDAQWVEDTGQSGDDEKARIWAAIQGSSRA